MRQALTALILTLAMALPGAARANESALFEAVAELPAAQVLCLGAADFPEMLRFAFQAEPEGRGRPEVIRTTSRRGGESRSAARQPASRVAAARPAGLPILRLPCIQG